MSGNNQFNIAEKGSDGIKCGCEDFSEEDMKKVEILSVGTELL
jgi:hypothetical protein